MNPRYNNTEDDYNTVFCSSKIPPNRQRTAFVLFSLHRTLPENEEASISLNFKWVQRKVPAFG